MTRTSHTPATTPDRPRPAVRYDVVTHDPEVAARPPFPYALAAGLLIGAWVVLNLAYLAFDCPLDLAPDEAHYWQWSRHLDWSYYSKGPLVAWLIRGSCELFGVLSVRLVGTEMLAVRLPAVLSSAALLAGIYVLSDGVLKSRRAALAVVALALTLPPITVSAVVMTIDPPFLACWCWALVGVWKAVSGGGPTWWAFAGVCSAGGVLAKYPMLLFPAAVVGFLVVNRRAEFRRGGVWLFLGLTALGCVPIVVWNAGHDWVSVRHALGQAGVGDGVKARPFRWLGPLGFAAGQCGVLLGFWSVAFVAAGYRWRRTTDTGLSLLWWASFPVWAVFLVASARNAGQVNWPAAAYVGGLVLAVAWVRAQLAGPYRRRVAAALAVAVVAGVTASVALRYPALTRPALARLAGPPTAADPTPLRKLDPTCRLRGWRTLAAEIDRVRDRVKGDTGTDPALAGMLWTTPGELAFYCRDHPPAYSFGLALADRHSQYDVWRPNPVADAQEFRGRSFVYVGDEIPNAAAVFDRVEPPIRVVHTEDGVPVAAWTVWVGHGFRGFPPAVRSGRPSY